MSGNAVSGTYSTLAHGYTLEWIDAELHRLKTIRNTLVPIMRFPAEVLTRMVRLALETPRSKENFAPAYAAREDCLALVKMTQICATWRQILIADHGLWSVLSCRDLHEELFALFVQRVGRYSVSVHLIEEMDFDDEDEGSEDDDHQQMITRIRHNLTCVLQSGCSIEKLEIIINSEKILPILRRAIKDYSTNLQSLQVLRFEWDLPIPLCKVDKIFPWGIPPLLKYLELRSCDYLWSNLASLRNLTWLNLTIIGESQHKLIDLAGWRTVLSSLSDTLERFKLCQWSNQQVPPTRVLPSDLNRLKGETPIHMRRLRELQLAMEGAACLASQLKGSPNASIDLSDKLEDWDAVVQVFNYNFTPANTIPIPPDVRYDFKIEYFTDESDNAPNLRLKSCDDDDITTFYLNFDAHLPHVEDFICRLTPEIRSHMVHLHLENSSDVSKSRPYDYQRMSALLPGITTISINVSYNENNGGQEHYILLPEWASSVSISDITFPKVRTLILDGAYLDVGNNGGASVTLLAALGNRMKLQLPITELRLENWSRISEEYEQEIMKINPQCSVIVDESPEQIPDPFAMDTDSDSSDE